LVYLITGGAGFIGSHLAERLLERGDQVLLMDNLSTGSMENIRHLKKYDRMQYFLEPLENRQLLAELVDEADAIFGKRSEVRDSHDRYANIEVGYLLQRMEEYEGIAILATNFRKNMDDAFVRRLHFTVEFPFPDQEDRHRIWQGIWPNDTPLEATLDLELLAARYEMAGGNIKNIALAAAFLAADDGEIVRMDHVVQATLREYQKTGKLIVDEGGFGAEDRRARWSRG